VARNTAPRELTFEVPISKESQTSPLTEALKHIRVVQVLEFRSEGFVLICRGTREESELFRKSISGRPRDNIRATVLNTDKSGAEVLLVSGKWLIGMKDGLDRRQAKELEFFKAMEKAPFYNLERPTFEGGKLRVSIIADEKLIKKLLSGLERVEVPYKILRMGRPKAQSASALNSLTAKQGGILRLAHAMGYYDIPRRTSTEDLARLLKMDKGTVGEHLRRAEKHLVDGLLS
jgi:predicted DNA binding protein